MIAEVRYSSCSIHRRRREKEHSFDEIGKTSSGEEYKVSENLYDGAVCVTEPNHEEASSWQRKQSVQGVVNGQGKTSAKSKVIHVRERLLQRCRSK
jgi:hypothetical protein